MTEDHHDIAFAAAQAAAPPHVSWADVERICAAYIDALHIRVTTVHDATPLTPEQALDAFRPRDMEV